MICSRFRPPPSEWMCHGFDRLSVNGRATELTASLWMAEPQIWLPPCEWLSHGFDRLPVNDWATDWTASWMTNWFWFPPPLGWSYIFLLNNCSNSQFGKVKKVQLVICCYYSKSNFSIHDAACSEEKCNISCDCVIDKVVHLKTSVRKYYTFKIRTCVF